MIKSIKIILAIVFLAFLALVSALTIAISVSVVDIMFMYAGYYFSTGDDATKETKIFGYICYVIGLAIFALLIYAMVKVKW